MARRRSLDRTEIARVIRDAIAANIPAEIAVREVFNLSPTRARYYIRATRLEGLLADVDQEVHLPTRATIHRTTSSEKSWLVCQECLSLWPCVASSLSDALPPEASTL